MSKALSVLFNFARIVIGLHLTVIGAAAVLLPIITPVVVVITHAPAPNVDFFTAVFGMVCGVVVTILGLRCLRVIKELPF